MSQEPRLIRFTNTEDFYVKVDDDTARHLLGLRDEQPWDTPAKERYALDITDAAELWERLKRMSEYGYGHSDGVLAVEDVTDESDYLADWIEPFDATGVNHDHGYLWSARHFLGRARDMLSRGRYREGHCPELDEVNGHLTKVEERLRLMALAAGKGAVR